MRYALLDFVADFANWDASVQAEFIETARRITKLSHDSVEVSSSNRTVVLDPFAGGGAFPLEIARIGGEPIATDLNPIPVMLNRLLLEQLPAAASTLSSDFDATAKEVRDRVWKRLQPVYERESGTPLAYLWSRSISCEGPNCGLGIPLFSSPWLCKRTGKYVWLECPGASAGGVVDVTIRSSPKTPSEPPIGTSKLGSATCPACGYTTPKKAVYSQLVGNRGGAKGARLLAVVCVNDSQPGRVYEQPTPADLEQVSQAERLLDPGQLDHLHQSINPISPGKFGSGVASPTRIGCEQFVDLYSSRQLLVLQTICDEIRSIDDPIMRLLLACAVGRLADYNSAHTRWNAPGEKMGNTFGRQAISIAWSFAEVNPFSGATADWNSATAWISKVVRHISDSRLELGHARRASATEIPLPDDSVAAVLTDPPYYGAIMYSDLSDYFYVWLRKIVGQEYPDLFDTGLVPKSEEIIATPTSQGPSGEDKDSEFFSRQMCRALTEAHRVVVPSGVMVVVFAHKSTDGWEAMLSALIKAGWTVTASWPIDTERQGRTNAQGTAALGSSVHLVCRPRPSGGSASSSCDTELIGDWRSVLRELPVRIAEWMPRLSEEGIVGADAIFACIGPALESFSKYSSVEKASGERIGLADYLLEVWSAISREALSMVFEGADASGFDEDARLTAMWLWTIRTTVNGATDDDDVEKAASTRGYDLEYDAARKIAQGLGVHLENLGHLVHVKGDTATLLSAGARTKHLFGKNAGEAPKKRRRKKAEHQKTFDFAKEVDELQREAGDWSGEFVAEAGSTVLDQLHQSMILFGAGRGEALRRFIIDDSVGSNPMFWRLAQALSALYPVAFEEKRWVDGVLARKKGLGF